MQRKDWGSRGGGTVVVKCLAWYHIHVHCMITPQARIKLRWWKKRSNTVAAEKNGEVKGKGGGASCCSCFVLLRGVFFTKKYLCPEFFNFRRKKRWCKLLHYYVQTCTLYVYIMSCVQKYCTSSWSCMTTVQLYHHIYESTKITIMLWVWIQLLELGTNM